jgi:hypothetical protein
MLSSPVGAGGAGVGVAFVELASDIRLATEAAPVGCADLASVRGERWTQKDSADTEDVEGIGRAVCAGAGWAKMLANTVNPASSRIFLRRERLNTRAPFAILRGPAQAPVEIRKKNRRLLMEDR